MADLTVLTWILLMTFLDGIVALIGVFSLWLKDRILRKIIMVLVAFSAGALLSGGLFPSTCRIFRTFNNNSFFFSSPFRIYSFLSYRKVFKMASLP